MSPSCVIERDLLGRCVGRLKRGGDVLLREVRDKATLAQVAETCERLDFRARLIDKGEQGWRKRLQAIGTP